MASSFVIYIDEAGDEGFKFRPGGSSEWFVLSAVVVRKEKDFRVVECMDRIRALLNRQRKQALHFKKLEHSHCVAWAQEIAKSPLKLISILIHKPSLKESEHFTQEAFKLYRYASRLLIERCSWLYRDSFNGNGDGKAELIFSNRERMSYDEIRDYWEMLHNGASHTEVRISWNHINTQTVRAVNHDQLAGLQIADCVASAHFQAVTKDRFGNAEPKYFQQLPGLLYDYKGKVLNYGLKFIPTLNEIRPSQAHLSFSMA